MDNYCVDESEIKQILFQLNQKVDNLVNKELINSDVTFKEFIIPLFEALGWSFDPKHDDIINVKEISKNRADYVFQIQGIGKFYLKCVGLNDSLENRDLLIGISTYAFNKGITWAIITNFRKIRVLNSEVKGKSIGQMQFFELHNEDYIDKFEQLSYLQKKSFELEILDKEAEYFAKKQKRTPIDKQLLEDLLKFTDELIFDIQKNNSIKFSVDEISEAVHKLLNRLIFIRVCGDRGLEQKHLISHLREWEESKNDDLITHLKVIFQYFKENYGGSLFSEHLCDKLKISNEVLKNIIEGLYVSADKSIMYDFSIIEADVLGGMYEQYLRFMRIEEKNGKLLTSHRKEQGIFYTPMFVVEFIVKNTLGRSYNSKNKNNELRILDPACGSGSFLIKAYDFLYEQYVKKDKDFHQTHLSTDIEGGVYSKKVKIIKENLYGVDLDKIATEIIQLNLLLKIAEKKHHLPILQQNIRFGNSLIEDEEFDAQFFKWKKEFHQIFDERGGFDIIIGNPPWVDNRGKRFSEKEKEYFNKYNESIGIIKEKRRKINQSGKLNLYSQFIVKSINLLRDEGFLGFVIPNNLLRRTTFDLVRKFILDTCNIILIADLGEGVFEKVSASSIIIILQKKSNETERNKNRIQIIFDIENLKSGKFKSHQIIQKLFYKNTSYMFNIHVEAGNNKINNKILENTVPLGTICKYIMQGIHGSKKYIYEKKINEKCKPFLDGGNIHRFKITYRNEYILYDRSLLHRARPEEVFTSKKIILQRVSGGNMPLIAALDDKKYYTYASTNNIVLKSDTQFSYEYITAILNSNLMNWYYSYNFSNKSKLTVNIVKTFLEKLPIKKIDKSEMNKIDEIVKAIISLENEDIKENDEKIHEYKTRLNHEIYRIYEIDDETKNKIEEMLTH